MTGIDEYVCPVCGYRSSSIATLKIHFVRKHKINFRHVCAICGRHFMGRVSLVNHLRCKCGLTNPLYLEIVSKRGAITRSAKGSLDPFALYETNLNCKHSWFLESNDTVVRHIWVEKLERYRCSLCGSTFTLRYRERLEQS